MTDDARLGRLEQRIRELDPLPDEELRARFWSLCEQVVEPMVDLARTHTSPSIERSVLLRMGIDSLSSQGVVTRIHEAGLLGKGAGHVLLRLAQHQGTDVRAAAAAVLTDPTVLHGLFEDRLGTSAAPGGPGAPKATPGDGEQPHA
ncbi:MAG TPA: D-ornithine 4,5-aminomutase subunit OraS [Motilibacterales bacterium]|nr:D-ornithine 4,5-aminomutase subunit OraS [Motilibacterales bacterium]